MELEILSRVENPLLYREELKVKIVHDKAPIPSRESVVKKLSALLNKDIEQIIVRKLDGQFGAAETIAHVFVYDSEERAKQIERPYILKRHHKGEEEEGGA